MHVGTDFELLLLILEAVCFGMRVRFHIAGISSGRPPVPCFLVLIFIQG